MVAKKLDTARIFEYHGAEFSGTSGNQLVGTCPVCDKENKLYVNQANGLWDCKYCDASGNYLGFLRHVWHGLYRPAFTGEHVEELARFRKLPLSAFQNETDIGWDPVNETWVVSMPNAEGNIQDVRRYNRKTKRMYSSPGCKVELLGVTELVDKKRMNEPVFICEGEWDRYALKGLLRWTNNKGVVVAVPGAGTFKTDWIPMFQGRTVYCCYDNDLPGAKGDQKAYERLHGTASKLRHLHWIPSCPDGWDINDWVHNGTVKRKKPRKCYDALMVSFKSKPRHSVPSGVESEEEEEPEEQEEIEPKTLEEVRDTFNKWLVLPDFTPVEVALAVSLSQRVPGDPLWIFEVGPPGSAKTEILRGLEGAPGVVYREGLTPHSLVSGMPKRGRYDPSLMAILDQKTLIVKDFTGVIGMRDADREEIFSTLRMAYDGKVTKQFGVGVKEYTAQFTILAAVTGVIYTAMTEHAALGERFLNYPMMDKLTVRQEEEICDRVLEMAGYEVQMREEIRLAMRGFFENFEVPKHLPEPDEAMRLKLRALGRALAHCRGTVMRDKFRPDKVDTRPSHEMPTRGMKQLKRLAMMIAIVRGKDKIGEEEYAVARRCALHSMPQLRLDILRVMWDRFVANPNAGTTFQELIGATRYPMATVSRVTQDLTLLNLAERARGSRTLTLSEDALNMFSESGLFLEPQRKRIKIKKGITYLSPLTGRGNQVQ
jgi:hypothetical protein